MLALLLLLLVAVAPHTQAFSAVSRKSSLSPPPFRQVLGQVGKKIFRPGGSAATEKLHRWARGLDSNSKVVEFATGPGTGMDLVAKTGCCLLVTDPFQDTLDSARESADRRGILDKCEFKLVPFMGDNMDWIKQDQEIFDVAIVEAVLTKYPMESKKRILKQLHEVTGQLLLHEICIRGCSSDDGLCADGVKENVGGALATNYEPLTTETWLHILEESGFTITDIETGPIQLLKPLTMLQDEGVLGAAQIGFNLATQEHLRERFIQTRAVLENYESAIGYMIVHAVAKK